MVEMKETAAIMQRATQRSFVVCDEIGRGTSTMDGLAIAETVIAELIHIRCRTLIATHYHEIAMALSDNSAVRMKRMETDAESDDAVVFTHRVVDGVVSNSYGIAVCQIAGISQRICDRARSTLAKLTAAQRSYQRDIVAALKQ